LSSALARAEEIRGMEGVRVCINAPSVSHLLLYGDFVILMEANIINLTSLRQVTTGMEAYADGLQPSA
jgi:hypothetical protein